jgi:Flp pilus assembly protein TadD
MRAAADLEDQSEKAAVSPGRLVPTRELLGDMLLDSGRPGEALAEFERSQTHDPNRFRTLYGAGQAAAQAGNGEKARQYLAQLIALTGTGNPRPEMVKARQFLASH